MSKQKGTSLPRLLLGFLTRNWGLKLLALALAILTYYTLKTSPDSKTTRYDRNILQK